MAASLVRDIGERPRLGGRDIEITHPPADLVVLGSPRFNQLADRLQQHLALRCQYVSARAKGDAATRDAADTLAPAQRVLRLVTADGEELSASVDHGHGGETGGSDTGPHSGIDYGLITYARLANGRHLLWISGIHDAGAVGAAEVVHEQGPRLDEAVQGVHSSEPFALTQLVRATYGARVSAECFGDAMLSRHSPAAGLPASSHQSTAVTAGIRGILFDLGDVVMKFDRDRSYRAIAHLHGSDYASIRATMRRPGR